jgi:AraC-like DNA-binding protein
MLALSDRYQFGTRPEHESRIANYLLEMISISYTGGFDCQSSPSAAAWRRRKDIVRYIEDHLREPTLTAESVAEGVHLSSRHLRTIFSASGEKVSAYILRRRLEECARKIKDPAWTNQTLMKIAFSWGFNSAAHFTRSFRDQFGVSPREYRRAADRQP